MEFFHLAHQHKPGGPSLEIGTRAGGSAYGILLVLEMVYGETAPMLFTVDPYGEKPYPKGDPNAGGLEELSYGSDFFTQQKKLLAPFPNHAHFYMRGEDFTEKLLGMPYWYRGEEKHLIDFSLAYLDGDHSSEVLLKTLRQLEPYMAYDGMILIDNANWQGDITKQILDGKVELVIYNGRTALLRKV